MGIFNLHVTLYFLQVCSDWRDIALTLRDRVFEDHEEQLIDIYDVKVSSCIFFL